MFYNILDKNRIKLLPLLKNFKRDFYLAGGTGLALQLGHRDSIDFDFFSKKDIDTKKLYTKIKDIFKDYKILKIQEDKNTLSVLLNNNIKLSFFSYKYKLVDKLLDEKYFYIAGIKDIACMKLSAITGRSTNKDYVDLYFILKKFRLKDLLIGTIRKFPDLDINLIMKSLVYFKDIDKEPIKFKNNNKVSFKQIENFLKRVV